MFFKARLLQLLVFCTPLFLQAQSLSWDAVYQKSKRSIPFIYSSGGLCAGALIQSGLILTAKHCVAKQRDIWISWIDNPRAWEKAQLLYMHPDLDFALLALEQTPLDRESLRLRESGPLSEGSEAATIGHPTRGTLSSNPPFALDLTHVFSAGHISKFTGDELVVDLSISPGNSGGPVFDKDGRIIGVVSRKLIQQFVGHIGYAVSHEPVLKALDKLQNSQLQRPHWAEIPSNLAFQVLLNWDAYQKTLTGPATKYRTSFNFEWTFVDRVVLKYNNNFGLNKLAFESYGLGYKFQRDLNRNKVPVWITPSFEGMEYKPKNIPTTRTHYARSLLVDFGIQGLPLAFRVGRVSAQENSFWLFALKIGN
jgi:hypothetical protein